MIKREREEREERDRERGRQTDRHRDRERPSFLCGCTFRRQHSLAQRFASIGSWPSSNEES